MADDYAWIERDWLNKTQPRDRPQAVLLGGQPGSGKSRLASEAQSEFSKLGNAVRIDADQMRERHPRYKALLKADPLNAADLTHADAAAWASRLTQAAIREKRNVVIDGTMRDPQAIRRLALMLRTNGYEIEARVMAVPAEVSLTRAKQRFERAVSQSGTGRFVNIEQHNRAFAAIPSTLALLENEKLVDRLRLYDAHQKLIYENDLVRGKWRDQPIASQVLKAERGENSKAPLLPRSIAYDRADAFLTLPIKEALAKYPELDGAYALLNAHRQPHELNQTMPPSERAIAALSEALIGRIRAGEIPSGPVTPEESLKVIALAAAARGIRSVRDADQLQRPMQGVVAAVSTHHALLRLSDDVAVRIEKSAINQPVLSGQALSIGAKTVDGIRQVSNDVSNLPGKFRGMEPER